MSAPDLPQHFGNYALGSDFVELTSPTAISWLPQTPGWYLVGVIILIWLMRMGWRRSVHWYRNRYRREATRRLDALAQQHQADWLLQLNQLLKLTALAGYSRETVARLSGLEWVGFLNAQCPEPLFQGDLEQCFGDDLYANRPLSEHKKSELITASRRWIIEHSGQAHV